MFTLNPLPTQVAPDIQEVLVRAEPATIGHFPRTGFITPEIRLLPPGYVRVAGTAVTARCHGSDGTTVDCALGRLCPGAIGASRLSGRNGRA